MDCLSYYDDVNISNNYLSFRKSPVSYNIFTYNLHKAKATVPFQAPR